MSERGKQIGFPSFWVVLGSSIVQVNLTFDVIVKADIYSEFRSSRLRLDKDAFTAAVQGWPEPRAAELRQVIRARFGDENFSSASVRHAVSILRDWPLDSLTQSALIMLGECPPEDADAMKERLTALRRFYWYLMAGSPDKDFNCLLTLPDSAGAALVRGLALAEEFGYSRYRGSVSLVCFAFRVFQGKGSDTWAPLADWLVTHSTNPWVPFTFCKSRWEACRAPGRTPAEIWKAIGVLKTQANRQKQQRAQRHQIQTVINKFRHGKAVDALASPELRERVIQEMERAILGE
jgi:hypothetical protein